MNAHISITLPEWSWINTLMQSLQNTQTRPSWHHLFTFPEWFRFSLLTALVGKLVVGCWFVGMFMNKRYVSDTRVVDSVILNTVHVEDHFTRKGQSFHAGLLNEKHLCFYFWLKYESVIHNTLPPSEKVNVVLSFLA